MGRPYLATCGAENSWCSSPQSGRRKVTRGKSPSETRAPDESPRSGRRRTCTRHDYAPPAPRAATKGLHRSMGLRLPLGSRTAIDIARRLLRRLKRAPVRLAQARQNTPHQTQQVGAASSEGGAGEVVGSDGFWSLSELSPSPQSGRRKVARGKSPSETRAPDESPRSGRRRKRTRHDYAPPAPRAWGQRVYITMGSRLP